MNRTTRNAVAFAVGVGLGMALYVGGVRAAPTEGEQDIIDLLSHIGAALSFIGGWLVAK